MRIQSINNSGLLKMLMHLSKFHQMANEDMKIIIISFFRHFRYIRQLHDIQVENVFQASTNWKLFGRTASFESI